MRELRLRMPRSAFAALGVDNLLELWDDCDDISLRSISCRGCSGTVMLEVDAPLETDRFEALDYVTSIDLVGHAPDHFEYLLGVELPRCQEPLDECTGEFFVDGPLRMTDGGLTFTAVATQDALEHLATAFAFDAGVGEWEVLHASEYTGRRTRLAGLTERQREILTAAFERDYFEVPRGVTAEELAAEFELDKSTVLEHLRRAERNLLANVFNRDREAFGVRS